MATTLLLRRLLGGFLIIALLAVVAVTVRFFADNSRRDKHSPAKQLAADVALKSIHFTESDAGRKKWELFSESGKYDKAEEKTTLSGIRFIVENDQKGPVTVTAKHGEYFHSSRNLILNGDVVARMKDGAFFETPSLSYNSKSRNFSTKERVMFEDSGLAVEGVGMDFKMDGFTARVNSKVSATLYPGKRGQ